MRLLAPLIILLLLAAGCPRQDAAAPGQPGTPDTTAQEPSAGEAPAGDGAEGEQTDAASGVRTGVPQVALVFAATPGDAWAREMVQTAAGDLKFEAWSAAGDFEGLDTYGPYDVELGGGEAQLHIAFSGLAAVATLPEQQALGQRCKDWLDRFSPAVVWLDGDIAQFQVGSLVEVDIPVVFSGVVLDADIFYSEFRPYTGVYKRHGMSAVLGRVWAEDPEARHYALISDDAPMSAEQVRRFVDIQGLLGEGHFFTVQPTVRSWSELRGVLKGLGDDIDAAIVCGMGNEGAADELLDKACPADILRGIDIPVVTLGPTRMDGSGALAVTVRPAAHARAALSLVGQLLKGASTDDLPAQTPDDMSLFQTDQRGE